MKDFAVKGWEGSWARTYALDIKDAEDAVKYIQMGSICSPWWPDLISHWHRSDRCSIRTSIEWNYVAPLGPFPYKTSLTWMLYIDPFIHYWNAPTSRESFLVSKHPTLLIWAKINTAGESELFCFQIKDLSTVSCKTAIVREWADLKKHSPLLQPGIERKLKKIHARLKVIFSIEMQPN